MTVPSYLRIVELKLEPGEEWVDETTAWRFFQITSGGAYWLGCPESRALSPGELIVVPPELHAAVRASQINPVVLHAFALALDWLSGFFTLAERHCFESGSATAGGKVVFLPSTHPSAERFSELVKSLEENQDLSTRAEVLGLAARVFDGLMAHYPQQTTRRASAGKRFQKIISQMPDIEIIHHTPEALAALCGCSSRHFSRLFRSHFGEPPRAKQAELRLLKARHLLATTDSKIIQIALDSGYRSLSLFNSVFKRRFGLSPSGYRSKAAKNGLESP
jgi:AraC-like DNA-binding protein